MPHWLARVPRTDEVLEQVAAQGRGYSLHLIMGSQRADEASVGRAAYNAACRIVGKLGSGVYSYATTGRAGAEDDVVHGVHSSLQRVKKQGRLLPTALGVIQPCRQAWLDGGSVDASMMAAGVFTAPSGRVCRP
jgi:hypothetical protein